MRDVERFMRRTALREGFVLDYHRGTTSNADIAYVVREYGAYGAALNRATSTAEKAHYSVIEIVAPDKASPQLIFWTFLHELGHVRQARAMTWGEFLLWTEFSRYSFEKDAWNKALTIAESMGIYPSIKARQYMASCLDSYL